MGAREWVVYWRQRPARPRRYASAGFDSEAEALAFVALLRAQGFRPRGVVPV
jgi:hypothetical protein